MLNEEISELEKTDQYLITANITLITGFSTFLSINNPQKLSIFSIFSLVALFCFSISLLLAFWHKVRQAKRNKLYQFKRKEAGEKEKERLSDFLDMVRETIQDRSQLLKEKAKSLNTSGIEDLFQKEHAQLKKRFQWTIEPLANIMSANFKKSYQASYNEPLDEKNRKLKYYIDLFARRFRYHFFLLGLLSFFITILTNLVEFNIK